MSLGKRVRTANFTANEKMLLLELVKANRTIVENKKTDKYWVTQKVRTWQAIADIFNSTAGSEIKRETKSLKTLYENIRHDAAKELAAAAIKPNSVGLQYKTVSKISEMALDIMKDRLTNGENSIDSTEHFNNDSSIMDENPDVLLIPKLEPIDSDTGLVPPLSLISSPNASRSPPANSNESPTRSILEPKITIETPNSTYMNHKRPHKRVMFSNHNHKMKDRIVVSNNAESRYFERALQMKEEKHKLEIKLLQQQIAVAEQQLKNERLEEMKKNIETSKLASYHDYEIVTP